MPSGIIKKFPLFSIIAHSQRGIINSENIVAKKIVSVSSKIVSVLRKLWSGKRESLKSVFLESHSRSELVATFLAVLELCKANRVRIQGEGDEMTVTLIKENNKSED